MSNLPAKTGNDTLEDLASKIKACILRVEDCRLELAKHFASAHRLCKAKGKPFKQWLADSATATPRLSGSPGSVRPRIPARHLKTCATGPRQAWRRVGLLRYVA